MKQKIIDQLIQINAVKFGEFQLKSGILSPIYIDLRIIISFPELLQNIAHSMAELAQNLNYDRIAGIPYTALPIATAFSLLTKKPMIYCRKEKKDYGTKQQIEGCWSPQEKILIIDDLITKGTSKFETLNLFNNNGLYIQDILVLIDREQNGKELLKENGYHLHALIKISEILTRLKELNQISHTQFEEIQNFLISTK